MQMTSPPQAVLRLGPDGIAIEPPVIAYTEKILEEKELELKRYIEDNYSKIRNVERELASLALEIKLTAGPKKAALEHLRKKIELSAEKIKIARQREEQAKKVWEAATTALKVEEENKLKLCEDLNRLVQESAASQYSRLEELKKRLVALNPELPGGESLANGKESFGRSSHCKDPSQEEVAKDELNITSSSLSKASKVTDGAARALSGKVSTRRAISEGENPTSLQRPSQTIHENRSNVSRPTQARIGPSRGFSAHKVKPNSWTGAGFDVDDKSETLH